MPILVRGIPLERVIELVNQLFNISKAESIPLDQAYEYIKEKLEEKQKIDEEIKEADAILQTKNVKVKTINDYAKLNEKLSKHGLSTQDINKLVKLVVNAKRYGFDAKKFVAKLSNVKDLEKKEKRLGGNCAVLSKKEAKYREIIPLAELIWDLHIGRSELISFKIAVNEAVQMYGLTSSAAALHVINTLRDNNEKGQLKKELSDLNLQKYAINEFCSSRGQVIMALMNSHSHGITEEQIISLNRFLENNAYNVVKFKS